MELASSYLVKIILVIRRFSMIRQYLNIISFIVLLVSSVLIAGCSEAAPVSATTTTQTITQLLILPSNVTQPIETPLATVAVPVISLQDASVLIQNNKVNLDLIIIDVRTPDEFNGGHLANAININYYSPEFKSNIDKLDRNKEYLIYCRTGVRGTGATQIMIDLGFTRVYNLAGGIVQWIDAGYPTLK